MHLPDQEDGSAQGSQEKGISVAVWKRGLACLYVSRETMDDRSALDVLVQLSDSEGEEP